MKEYLWWLLAKFLAKPAVAEWLIKQAFKTPWYPIEGIMHRYWLFNPYQENNGNGGEERKRSWFWTLLPSIRIHHIFGADQDPHLHDHPWNCRTIILKGWYIEEVENTDLMFVDFHLSTSRHVREAGHTGAFKPLQWHKIYTVQKWDYQDQYCGGAWTLFITWKYKEPWGFLVDGKKMLSRDYFEYRKQWRNKK